ncbi:MAG: TetR/AcrR family transcriptional regulator [Pseudobacteriovorax sp.]|nr:TetR/AcrR family transcriptional regulator [Pseudobacteriovorax sp.]
MKLEKRSNTKTRVFEAAKTLFSQKGYDAASVRDICKLADASITAIRIHFGSKEQLLDEILAELDNSVFKAPIRILGGNIQNKEQFITKFKIFMSETLHALLSEKETVLIAVREQHRSKWYLKMGVYHENLVAFIRSAQKNKIVSKSIKVDLVTGMFMDRLVAQIIFEQGIEEAFENTIRDPIYREEWLDASLDLLLSGLLVRKN